MDITLPTPFLSSLSRAGSELIETQGLKDEPQVTWLGLLMVTLFIVVQASHSRLEGGSSAKDSYTLWHGCLERKKKSNPNQPFSCKEQKVTMCDKDID